jgi:CBS domain-containing protein
MYVKDILQHKGNDVFTVTPEATVKELAKSLAVHGIGAAVVVDGESGVVGVVSERDVIHGIAEHGDGCMGKPVRDLMTTEVITCDSETQIQDVMSLMTERRFRHVPVVEDGALIGLVSIGDVVRDRIAEAEREAAQLRQYITA